MPVPYLCVLHVGAGRDASERTAAAAASIQRFDPFRVVGYKQYRKWKFGRCHFDPDASGVVCGEVPVATSTFGVSI